MHSNAVILGLGGVLVVVILVVNVIVGANTFYIQCFSRTQYAYVQTSMNQATHPTTPPKTRNQLSKQYSAAGVLPYTVHADQKHTPKRVLVLLGGEQHSPHACMRWKDFGGGREPEDNYDPVNTAAREFAEETLGMFGGGYDVSDACVQQSAHLMAQRLQHSSPAMHMLSSGAVYVMYSAYVPFVDPYLLHAGNSSCEGVHGGGEKAAFAWSVGCVVQSCIIGGVSRLCAPTHPNNRVDLLALLQSVATSARKYTVLPSHWHSGGAQPARMRLHTAFACTIRSAVQCGALHEMLEVGGIGVAMGVPRGVMCYSCGLDTSVSWVSRRCGGRGVARLQRGRQKGRQKGGVGYGGSIDGATVHRTGGCWRKQKGSGKCKVTHQHMTYWVCVAAGVSESGGL